MKRMNMKTSFSSLNKHVKAFIPCILSLSFLISACSGSQQPEEPSKSQSASIVGNWKLVKRRLADRNLEKNFNGDPANIIVSIEKTGYFHIYDTLKNEKWLAGDLNSIHTRRIGQWTYEDSTLHFRYQDKDSSYKERIIITKLTEDELVMKRNKNQVTTFSYFKRNQ